MVHARPESGGPMRKMRVGRAGLFICAMYQPARSKIRGWKRRLRQIGAWEEREAFPSVEALQVRGYAYCRFIVPPWYQIGRRQMPLWFFREVLKGFARLHGRWQAHLAEKGLEAALQLWVFEPNRSQTELYAALRSPDTPLPFRPDPDNTPFPHHFYQLPELTDYQWPACLEDRHMDEQDLALEGLTEAELLATGWKMVTSPAGDRHYYKPVGWVWVGEKMPPGPGTLGQAFHFPL